MTDGDADGVGLVELLKALAVLEGASFAGLCNVAVVLFLAYVVRPRRPQPSVQAVLAVALYVLSGVVAFLICFSVLGPIGLL